MIKVHLNCLNHIQNFQVCVTIPVMISIIPTTCVFRREKWRDFDRASGIEHVFFVISL